MQYAYTNHAIAESSNVSLFLDRFSNPEQSTVFAKKIIVINFLSNYQSLMNRKPIECANILNIYFRTSGFMPDLIVPRA
jgi:hypothetical protein